MNEFRKLVPNARERAERDELRRRVAELEAERAAAIAGAVDAERERLAQMIANGDYCDIVEHHIGACNCGELAAAIRATRAKDSP